jgi:hypothetical protein
MGEGRSTNYVDYPSIAFCMSDDLNRFKLQDYVNRMVSETPANLQGFICNKTGFPRIEDSMFSDTLKYQLADVDLEWINHTQYSIYLRNRYQYSNLSEFDFDVALYYQGEKVSEKHLDNIDLAPGKSILRSVSLDYPIDAAKVYQLTLSCRLKNDKPWAQKGHLITRKSWWIQDSKAVPKH